VVLVQKGDRTLDAVPRRQKGVGGQRYAPAALPTGKSRVLIVEEIGWISGPLWMVPKNLNLTVFEPRTFQSERIRYTSCSSRKLGVG